MLKLLLFGFSISAFAACQVNPCGFSKERFLDNYEQFVDDVADQDLSSDSKAWKKYDERFERFTDNCYHRFEDKLTSREQRAFASHTVRYMVNRYGKSFFHDIEQDEQLKEDLRELGERIGAFAERLGDDLAKDINEMINQLDTETIEDAVEQARDFFNNLDIKIDYTKDDK